MTDATPQAGPQRTLLEGLLGYGAAWFALLCLAFWVRWSVPWALFGAAVGTVLFLLSRPPRTWRGAASRVLLILATVSAYAGQVALSHLSGDWPAISQSREVAAGADLTRDLDRLLAQGVAARDSIVFYLEETGGTDLQAYVEKIHARSGVDALAVLDATGALRAWAGTHHGPLPTLDRLLAEPFPMGSGPLFRYLYFPGSIPATGDLVMVADLLVADLPTDLGGGPEGFLGQFSAEAGIEAAIVPPAGTSVGSVWDLWWEDEILLSFEILPQSEAAARSSLALGWGRLVVLLIVLAWGTLALGTSQSRARRRLASASLVALAMVLPLGPILGLERLFDPTTFLLPPPVVATLGRLLAVGLAAVWTFGFARGRVRWPHLPPALAGVLGGVVLMLATALVRTGASGGSPRWSTAEVVGLQLAMVLMGSVPLRILLGGREEGKARGDRLVWAAVTLAVILSLASLWWAGRTPGLPSAWILLWAIPVALAAAGTKAGWGRWAPALRWGLAIALAVSASMPVVWGDWVQVRRRIAEEQLATLGLENDPYRQFLLYRWGQVTDSLAGSGIGEVELLFRSWVMSGLAEEGAEADLTLWSAGGLPREELRIGITGPRSSVARELQETEWDGRFRVEAVQRSNAQYVGLVRLLDGSVATAVLPPRRRLPAETPLGPLLTPETDLGSPLTLIPLVGFGGPVDGRSDGEVSWRRVPGGWRGETIVPFPEGPVQASYLLELPSGMLLVARGSLLAALDFVLLLTVWWMGVLFGRGAPPAGRSVMSGLVSFRGRVTLALFLFFLLPTSLFGTFVFRALSSASRRTSEVLADRTVEAGARAYFLVQRSLEPLAQRVGSDLLLYVNGRLVDASSEELFRLGLYEGWLPRQVHQSLERREDLRMASTARLGNWDYLLAYRRVAGEEVLAVPASLDAGQSALRPRELADLLGFALLLGAGLSLALALLVGRALAQPLQTLLVASERVGGGNLTVRLPDDRRDEFGGVFLAFNRMVRRISSSREELIQTTRRTETIVEEAAAGVMALGSSGLITVANARARALLSATLVPGEPLPQGEGPTGEVSAWIDRYFRDGLEEGTAEFQFDDRRIRLRARRIGHDDSRTGAVVILEDVTDELRSERILAWGEMARQVAHEVKNPLTPMKLSVQHIRRAWEDGRADFGEILARNADAVLGEIDRLDGIARGFSRMAPPADGSQEPIAPVHVDRVIRDLVALYSGGGGEVRFLADIPPDLPPAVGRETELKEVLINLLENAREAVGSDGIVSIRVEAGVDWLELYVTDNGPGIPQEVLPRVFEPHFSTRTGGTGLGLAIVDRVIRTWGGTVAVESQAGQGTSVQIRLPLESTEEDGGVPHAPESR